MPALRVALIYLLFGTLWIYLSDTFLGSQIGDPELLTQYQTYKGWFYVLITALLAYLLVAQALRRQSAAESSLSDSEARFHTIFDGVNDLILLRDADTGKIVEANAKAVEQLGYSAEELRKLDIADISEGTPPYTRKDAMAWLERARKGETPTFEWHARRRDGSLFWLEISLRKTEIGGKACILSLGRDITARKQSEAALQESREQLHAFFDNAQAIVWLKDLDGRFLMVNRYTEQLLGRPREQLLGRTVAEIFPPKDAEAFSGNDRKAIYAGAPLAFDETALLADGLHTFFSVRFPLYDARGNIHALGAICTDITERKATEARVEYLAYHDQLTGLPNRVLVRDRFEQAVAYTARNGGKVALLFLDLDHFKTINDALGHAVGDTLLKEVAARLQLCVRDTDTISRQGGDEFLIVLSDVRDAESISAFSGKMLEQLCQPFRIDGHDLSTSVSIGATVYPDDGENFDTLLKKADTAMYHAKEAGRNACYFFNTQMNLEADQRLDMRNRLSLALDRGEFAVHYQPQVDLASGALTGAEALLRWNQPELGTIPPDRFIPVAEDSGLIVPIGEWVLREACRQAVEWQKSGLSDFTMAVNLSAVQFKRGNLEQIVIDALTESGLEPQFLELELTESILIRDTENVLQTVRQLKLLGVKLSIDDFGTGYSSLAYLSRFAVDKVKIDQSFVRGLTTSSGDAAIVRAIIQMARSMGLRTIAEGVEEQHLYDYLRAHHCDEAQGYHIGRPMPAEQFAAHVAGNHPGQIRSR